MHGADHPTPRLPPDVHDLRRLLRRHLRQPWITDYQDDAVTGHVIGNLGGYNGGGNDANVDYISYAPAFGTDAANLLADAVAGQDPPGNLPPYQASRPNCPAERGLGSTPSCWPPASTPATSTAT